MTCLAPALAGLAPVRALTQKTIAISETITISLN